MAARLAPVPDLDEELDRLFGLPLQSYTSARNDLARRLRAAGQTEAAEATAKLPKPSGSAWAVNQLSRQRRGELEALVALGRGLADAQLRAVGGDDAADFVQLRSDHAHAVRSLSAAAIDVLERAGSRPSDAVKRRIGETLRALSLDPTDPNPLLEGRLTEDSQATGFSLLERFELPAKGVRRQGKRAAPARERRAELREQLRAARAAAREAAAQAASAGREAAASRRTAERLEQAAIKAAAEAEQSAAAVEALERQLREAKA
jgi:hypothetical protein